MTTMKAKYPFWLANEPVPAEASASHEELPVTDKYSNEVVSHVALAGPEELERAIAAGFAARGAMQELRPYERQAILLHCSARFRERREELAEVLAIEAGKPVSDSRGEVTRLIETFDVAAAEALRGGGEVLDLEITARVKGSRGMVRRYPVGLVSFITPFNFPLNLVAHKIAPAIAAGCPFVLKPSDRTPVSAMILGEILAETALPRGAFSIVPVKLEHIAPFIGDPRFALLSFTGSSKVGWDLKARAGRKKVVLELGGNAACVVDEDQEKNLDAVVDRLVFGAFYQSGQSCIGVQRIIAHRSLYRSLVDKLVAKTRTLVAGDPKDEKTFLGPMIDEAAAKRLHGWIEEATAKGAKVLVGGGRKGSMLEATVVEGVPHDLPLYAEEAFGPAVVVEPFDTFDEALRLVNEGDYGLQAGIFTNDLKKTMRAWDELEVGGVVIGDIPSFRIDNMPYGGVKGSGFGREGVRWAMNDMTEERLLLLRGI
ncbi:MAG: Delta-pyrroline-5-carboxylate dehydrogenase [Labilithrix sp.]|nr:Delta-pyrroline-5-carboxylate dehydrogenase [Labilithrix sp.]